MRPDSNKKLLELLSVEICIQVGFEKATEHSISLITDVFIFYLESLIKKIIPLKDINPEIASKFLIEDTYDHEQYQIKELTTFLLQQIAIKSQLIEKYDLDCSESLLHSLRILPAGVSLKSVFKNTKTMTLEEKKSMEVYQEIQMDKFMIDFIEKCSKEPNKRQIETYCFDCLPLVENVNKDDKEKETFLIDSLKPKSSIMGYNDEILAEQELFIEDFNESSKYVIFH